MESEKIVDMAVSMALEKKGIDVTVMEMAGVCLMCDYFVLVSASSRPHARAIALHIEDTLKKLVKTPEKNIQGKDECSWILLDYGNVVVHVFLEELRAYYNLEGLWKEAKIRRPRREVSA